MSKIILTLDNGEEIVIEARLTQTKDVFEKYQHLDYQISNQKNIDWNSEKPLKEYPWVPIHETVLAEIWSAIKTDLTSGTIIVPVSESEKGLGVT